MNKARLIITERCTRTCSYCCNMVERIRDQMLTVATAAAVAKHDIACITGGEPLLELETTIRAIKTIRRFNPRCVIYLYTSIWRHKFAVVLPLVDGVNYTVHAGPTAADASMLSWFQAAASAYLDEHTHRLALDPTIATTLPLQPRVWSEIRIKQWKDAETVGIPKNEHLYILDSARGTKKR
jgi:pyruvate-formate lyase-activating enzyme